MTKRDYELIAQCISKVRGEYPDAHGALNALALVFAATLREGNRRFDIRRFISATYKEASLEQDARWLRSV